MRALREQPRLVTAKLALAIAALVATALVGATIASDDPEAPPDLRPRLERSEQLRRDQTSELQRLGAQVARLRGELRTATRRARERARTSERLRRELRAARRSPAGEARP
jgi:septal ring factor EnvC (AmiA/AmiB activator)